MCGTLQGKNDTMPWDPFTTETGEKRGGEGGEGGEGRGIGKGGEEREGRGGEGRGGGIGKGKGGEGGRGGEERGGEVREGGEGRRGEGRRGEESAHMYTDVSRPCSVTHTSVHRLCVTYRCCISHMVALNVSWILLTAIWYFPPFLHPPLFSFTCSSLHISSSPLPSNLHLSLPIPSPSPVKVPLLCLT